MNCDGGKYVKIIPFGQSCIHSDEDNDANGRGWHWYEEKFVEQIGWCGHTQGHTVEEVDDYDNDLFDNEWSCWLIMMVMIMKVMMTAQIYDIG